MSLFNITAQNLSWRGARNESQSMDNKCDINPLLGTHVYEFCCLIGLFSILLLSFCFAKPPGRWCRQTVFSLVPPLFLLEYGHRWDYIGQFGAIATSVSSIFTGTDITSLAMGNVTYAVDIPNFLATPFGMIRSVEIAIFAYPVFACLSVEDSAPVSIIGFVHSTIALAIDVYVLTGCPDPRPEVVPYITAIVMFPSLICRVWVTCSLFWKVLVAAYRGHWRRSRMRKLQVFEFQKKRVKYLLTPKRSPDSLSRSKRKLCNLIRKFWHEYFYDRNRCFRYPNRILCLLSVVFFMVYQITVFSWMISINIDLFAKKLLDGDGLAVLFQQFSVIVDLRDIAGVIINMVYFSWLVPAMVCNAFRVWNIILIMSNYRCHTLSIWRGNLNFLPKTYKNDGSESVAQTMRYAGYQIAYVIWAQFLLFFVGFLLLLAFCFIIILPVIIGFYDILWWLLEVILIPSGIGLAIFYICSFLARLLHLQQARDKSLKDNSKAIAFKNMNFFPVNDYLFFLFNIATGLFSSLWRILLGLLLGLFYLGRMDQCTMMPNFASLDKGFNAYMGMLIMEEHICHPVLRVFCGLLYDKIQHTKYFECYAHEDRKSAEIATDDTPVVELVNGKHATYKKKIFQPEGHSRRRWHLFYTLVRNPSLIHYRHAHRAKVPAHTEQLQPCSVSANHETLAEYYCDIKSCVAGIGAPSSKFLNIADSMVTHHVQDGHSNHNEDLKIITIPGSPVLHDDCQDLTYNSKL